MIEKRLLETELVVFELLSTIHNSPVTIEPHRSNDEERQAIADFSRRQSKSSKIEEWKSLPLGSDDQRNLWWQSRRSVIQAIGIMDGDPTMEHNTLAGSPGSVIVDAAMEGDLNMHHGTAHPSPLNREYLDASQPLHTPPSAASPSAVLEHVVYAPEESSPVVGNTHTIDQWRKYF